MSLTTVLEALQFEVGMTRFEADVFMRGGCGDVVERADKKAVAHGYVLDSSDHSEFWSSIGIDEDTYEAAIDEMMAD